MIPGSGTSPGEGNDSPLQFSCLGNPMNREAWWATVHGIEKEEPDMTEQVNITFISKHQTLVLYKSFPMTLTHIRTHRGACLQCKFLG